jgi:hypothetical protein
VTAEPAHRRGAATQAQVPALLKGLIFGPNGRAMSPSHTRRRGRIYRYYATRWQRMLDKGVYATVSEIGDAENISKSYVSRILRIALLAPDVVEAILAGKSDAELSLESLERPLPMGWEEQRTLAHRIHCLRPSTESLRVFRQRMT